MAKVRESPTLLRVVVVNCFNPYCQVDDPPGFCMVVALRGAVLSVAVVQPVPPVDPTKYQPSAFNPAVAGITEASTPVKSSLKRTSAFAIADNAVKAAPKVDAYFKYALM